MDINQLVAAEKLNVRINNRLENHHAVIGNDTTEALALTGLVGANDDASSSEHARRFAACWNACRAIPTEHLEKQGLATINISAYADSQRFEWFINNILAELDPEYAGATIDEIRALIDKQRSK